MLAGLAYGLTSYLDLARFATTSIGGHNGDALNAIAACALGGTSLFGGIGSALGSLIGVFIPAVLQNGLIIAEVRPFWQQIAVGIALLGAVYADRLRRRAQKA
jgi:ribose transport system permease protein